MMLSISSMSRLIQRHRWIYGVDQWTPSRNSAVPRQDDQTERRTTTTGAETELETMMHSRTTTIRTLPYGSMVTKTTAYKRWNCQVIRPANCCQLIPSNRFLDGFPDQSQFAATTLTHYSTMPHRPSDSSRLRQRLLLSDDVHQNPGPATKYPCSVCTRNVTNRGVAICAIVVLVGFIRSVLVFKTQRSTVELRTGHAALAVQHPLHQNRNGFHH